MKKKVATPHNIHSFFEDLFKDSDPFKNARASRPQIPTWVVPPTPANVVSPTPANDFVVHIGGAFCRATAAFWKELADSLERWTMHENQLRMREEEQQMRRQEEVRRRQEEARRRKWEPQTAQPQPTAQ